MEVVGSGLMDWWWRVVNEECGGLWRVLMVDSIDVVEISGGEWWWRVVVSGE